MKTILARYKLEVYAFFEMTLYVCESVLYGTLLCILFFRDAIHPDNYAIAAIGVIIQILAVWAMKFNNQKLKKLIKQ